MLPHLEEIILDLIPPRDGYGVEVGPSDPLQLLQAIVGYAVVFLRQDLDVLEP